MVKKAERLLGKLNKNKFHLHSLAERIALMFWPHGLVSPCCTSCYNFWSGHHCISMNGKIQWIFWCSEFFSSVIFIFLSEKKVWVETVQSSFPRMCVFIDKFDNRWHIHAVSIAFISPHAVLIAMQAWWLFRWMA